MTDFRPYLFYECSAGQEAIFRNRLARAVGLEEQQLRFRTVFLTNTYGWVPNRPAHPTGRKEHQYMQVFFPTLASMRKGMRATQYGRVHEDKIAPDTKFMDSCSLTTSGWMTVRGRPPANARRISHCAIEIESMSNDLVPQERASIAPLDMPIILSKLI